MKLGIEKAALKLILAHGPNNVTAEQIASSARVSRRTFFRYFPARDDVIAAMPARSMRVAMQALRARPARESIVDAFVAISRSNYLSKDEDEIMRLAEKVMRRFPDLWRKALAQVHSETSEVFSEAIAHRLRLKGRDDIDPAPIGAALNGAVTQIYVRWMADGASDSFADRLERGLKDLRRVLA